MKSVEWESAAAGEDDDGHDTNDGSEADDDIGDIETGIKGGIGKESLEEPPSEALEEPPSESLWSVA